MCESSLCWPLGQTATRASPLLHKKFDIIRMDVIMSSNVSQKGHLEERMMRNNILPPEKEKILPTTAMSQTRTRYFARLFGRCIIFIVCLVMCFVYPQTYAILEGMNFFDVFSPFHLLWLIWVCDMILQIIPIKNTVALGSQKLFANHFRPVREKINSKALKAYVISTTAAAYKVLILWALLNAGIGALYFCNVINKMWLFMISVFFYVCDLICVLVWCPFRLIMKNKCCTTCRIFNWDHLMMFLPLIFAGGFFSISLVVMALLAWLAWELCVLIYPERFCEMTNAALKCSACTDKLCTQYCQKLKK